MLVTPYIDNDYNKCSIFVFMQLCSIRILKSPPCSNVMKLCKHEDCACIGRLL